MIEVSWRTARRSGYGLLTSALLACPALLSSQAALAQSLIPSDSEQFTIQGELVTPDMIGPTIDEGWDAVLAREARMPKTGYNAKRRNGGQGAWAIAGLSRHGAAHSGQHYVINKYGDARLGIGLGRLTDVSGAWFVGQRDASAYPATIQAIGYKDGVVVGRAPAFSGFGETPTWYEMGLSGIDRLEIVVEPRSGTTGEYGMDDLTLVVDGATTVVDFESLENDAKLTSTGYAGLDWELGTGDFLAEVVHAPLTQETKGTGVDNEHATYGGSGTTPNLLSTIQGTRFSESGGWLPPDTCGAVGPTHFVEVVNSRISVWVKATGVRVMHTDLNAFLAGSSSGDPRVTYDKISQKFIVLATNFNNEISLAISNTSDPTGSWKKATFNPGQGTDAGKWSDYPTLGCNKDFIVTCAYMVGGSQLMSAFAIDKMNFINNGTLTITAFRSLPWEGAIQPATTWDDNASQYLVSRAGSGLRIRRVNPPANAATLTQVGIASTALGSAPPNAPQQGGPALDTLDGRLMNAVWINGHLWTTCSIASGGKAACRWWQVDTNTATVAQTGTVADTTYYYFAPSIAVNANNEVAMGFTGSHSGTFAACFYTGRKATDPSGEMGVPAQYKAGESAYNDGNGPRWGDYSLTSIDPADNLTFWTVTEYAESGGGANWGTYIASVGFDACDIHNYCVTSSNSAGAGTQISYSGSPSVSANDFGLFSFGNPVNQNGIFFMGPNQVQNAFGNGFLCVGGALTRYPIVQSDSFGIAIYDVDNTTPPALGKITNGSTWNWQYWYRDPMGGGSFFNLSDGLSVTYCP